MAFCGRAWNVFFFCVASPVVAFTRKAVIKRANSTAATVFIQVLLSFPKNLFTRPIQTPEWGRVRLLPHVVAPARRTHFRRYRSAEYAGLAYCMEDLAGKPEIDCHVGHSGQYL